MPTRIAAAVLAILGVVPFWRVLPQRATGLAGTATAELAANYTSLIWNGLLIALIPALIGALVIQPIAFEARLEKLARPLTRLRAGHYALALAILSMLLAATVAIGIMQGSPTLIDSFAQLTHARYLAAGKVAGPITPYNEFWHIQQTLSTSKGWVSQYPPGYVVMLAAAMKLRVLELLGPLAFGVAIFFTTLIADRVLEHRTLARLAALIAAMSPFMLGLAGAYMSHVPAAALVCAAVYFTLRITENNAKWAAAAGACIGVLFSVRPLTGLVIGLVCALHVRGVKRIALSLAAAIPFALAVAMHNNYFFGSPFRFGYTAALGPHAGLGFGVDPWGNRYGVLEALGYTSAELIALSLYLLETPLPVIALIGVYFWMPRKYASPSPAPSLLFWICVAPVLANLFYWHHGLFMGPRMLADTGPLWVLLAVYAVAGLIRELRPDWTIAGKYSVRAFVTTGVLAALAAGLFLFTPQRLVSYSIGPQLRALLRAPRIQEPALVFVHGGWTSRIAMRLAAKGMRLDSVETALRQNSTCAVHHFAEQYARGHAPTIKLDFEPRSSNLPPLYELSPGNRIRAAPGEFADPSCGAEMASDARGVIDVSPFIWQGDLPGLQPRGALFVRDMGRQANARLIAAYRDRAPFILIENGRGGVRLLPYASARP